jgi:hypothetical protein
MIFLLGCDHYLQNYDLEDLMDEVQKIEHALKEKFYEIVKDIIKTQGIHFVGEECRPQQRTIPRALAEELGCTYSEIDMPTAERERLGIRPYHEDMESAIKARFNDLRESHMVDRIYASSNVEMRKLLVCGALHLNGLVRRLREREQDMIVRDITKEEWCDLPFARTARGDLLL